MIVRFTCRFEGTPAYTIKYFKKYIINIDMNHDFNYTWRQIATWKSNLFELELARLFSGRFTAILLANWQ
jgi:hypothetical protein